MTFSELIPQVRALPRPEKLRLMQILVDELVIETEVPIIEEGRTYEVWSPFNATGAAGILMQALEEENEDHG